MKDMKLLTLLVAGTAVLAACADDPVQPSLKDPQTVAAARPAKTDAAAEPARHLVVFSSSAPAHFSRTAAEFGASVVVNHRIGVAVISGLAESDVEAFKTAVSASHVEPAPEFQLIEPAAIGAPEETSLASELASAANPAGAALFARQWNMRQVEAPAAWAAGRLGSDRVTVAILDTGIDYLLPDLAGRVDLSRSASFEPRDDALVERFFPDRHPSTDLHFHGTNVATQVASNARFFAGVTAQTTLTSVKVCSVLGGCRGVAAGILYAIDTGADVINMSLGGWFNKSAFPGAVSAYNRIMNYASQRGVTIVVAAGNDANDLDTQDNIALYDKNGDLIDRVHIPSFFATYCDATHVICVSATRRNDVPASYTNYGRSAIDVAAPGGGSGDWVYSLCPETSLLFDCDHPRPGFYFIIGVAGTSQATPHVSGLAALGVQDVGRDPAQVGAYIRNSADAVDGGTTPYYGKGRINVARAVGAQ